MLSKCFQNYKYYSEENCFAKPSGGSFTIHGKPIGIFEKNLLPFLFLQTSCYLLLAAQQKSLFAFDRNEAEFKRRNLG